MSINFLLKEKVKFDEVKYVITNSIKKIELKTNT